MGETSCNQESVGAGLFVNLFIFADPALVIRQAS
jgi:hypothetical protein